MSPLSPAGGFCTEHVNTPHVKQHERPEASPPGQFVITDSGTEIRH